MSMTAILPADIQEYLASLDRKATAKPASGVYFPELRVIASDKLSEDLLQAKGTFVFITKDWDENKKFEVAWPAVEGVVIRTATQYTMFDEVEKKAVYFTNEFNYGEEVVLKSSEGVIVYRGDQAGLKSWALKNVPDPKSKPDYPKHLLKFKFVWYIIIPSKYTEQNPVDSVYRFYISVSSMENVNAWKQKLKGDPIRYITQFRTEKKDNGGVRFYPVVPTIYGENPMADLMKYVQVKKDLDEAVDSVNKEFCSTSAEIIPAKREIVEPVVSKVIEAPAKVVADIPFETSQSNGLSMAEIDAVFS